MMNLKTYKVEEVRHKSPMLYESIYITCTEEAESRLVVA
jgi:hypothetical protein